MGFTLKMDKSGAILKEDGKRTRLTREEANQMLDKRVITSVRIQQHAANPMAELWETFYKNFKDGHSPYGERMIVKKRFGCFQWRWPFQKGVNVFLRYALYRESGVFMHHITLNAKGITGALTDRGINYVEFFRILYQCAYSGASINDDDEQALRTVLEGRGRHGTVGTD